MVREIFSIEKNSDLLACLMKKSLNIFKILTLALLLSKIMPDVQSLNCKVFANGQHLSLTKEDSAVIRGIILSRGREGCTLAEIKRKSRVVEK